MKVHTPSKLDAYTKVPVKQGETNNLGSLGFVAYRAKQAFNNTIDYIYFFQFQNHQMIENVTGYFQRMALPFPIYVALFAIRESI